jgi:hypothetical protein
MPFSAPLVPLTSADARDNSFAANAALITPGAGDQLDPAGKYYKYFVAATGGDVTFRTYKGADATALTMTVSAGMILPGRIRRITAATATVHGWFD